MSIDPAGTSTSMKNVSFQPSAEDVARKAVIIGSYAAGKTITDEVPVVSLSPESTGDVYGFGSMLHRLHIQFNRGSDGQVPAFINPQAETGGAAAAAGEIDFVGSAGVLAGTLYLYIGFDLVRVSITDAMSVEDIADAVVAAVNLETSLNFIAAKTAVTFEVTFTSKTLGTYGNALTGAQLAFNLEANQSTPTGITAAFTQPVGGTGLPDIQDALDGMGTGDNKNSEGFTRGIHGYGQDTTTLDAIRDYIGVGDQLVGTYAKTVARPMTFQTGDVVAGSAGLTAVRAVGDARKTDRGNGIIPVPGSGSHPSEIGAQYVGMMERAAKESSGRGYGGLSFSRIHPGADADQWTNTETNRKLAINSGIGTTKVDGGVIFLSDTVSFYHPASIPENSNIYREEANLSKIRNILANEKTTFTAQTLAKSIIVQDMSKISSIRDRQFAIDINIVRSTHIALIKAFNGKGWLYETEFAIAELAVALRSATDGFDSIIKAILSGVNKISDNQVQADISTAVLS